MQCKVTSNHCRRSLLVQGGLEIKCEVIIDAWLTLLQSRLTARYLELVHSIYTEPVDERLMGQLILNFTITLPQLPTASLENKKGRESDRHMQLEMGAKIYLKCFRVLTRQEKCKDTTILSNLLATYRK